MALELNGSTGVSLVQDGVVVTDDLANGAVTAGKLASTLDLTGKTVTLPAGVGGKVLQVVQGSTGTQVEASFSSSTDVGLSVSITPSSTSSKVLIIVQCAGCGTRDTNTYYRLTLRRDSTNLVDGFAQYVGNGTGSGAEAYPNTVYLDSPNTTSAISYNLRATRQAGTANCYFNHAGPAFSTIAAMEVAG